MKPGKDFIGVGVTAVIQDKNGKILLKKRGALAKNDNGTWATPGGTVEFGEKMEDALVREMKEELDIDIKVVKQLGTVNHIMKNDLQHWVSTIFLCEIVKGEPKNMEPQKSDGFGWFALEEIQILPLGVIMKENLKIIKN
jgi:8-oxo-dGTP diphosphatase